MMIHNISEHIDEFCYDSERNFTRKRKLSPETLLTILVGMGGDPLRNELLKYWNYTLELATVPAFVQQRSKLKPQTLETLFQRFGKESVTSRLYCGYRLLAAAARFDYLPVKSNELYPLSFRIVRFSIGADSFETLITNLNATRFPPEKLRKLYAMRWGIETSFRQLKQTVGLRMFQAKKVEHIFQEIFARLIMYNFTELITSHVVIRNADRRYAYQANHSRGCISTSG